MLKHVLVDLLNHHLEGLVAITAAEAMEVEVEELELAFMLELVYLAHELGSDAHLTRRVVPEQVDDLARAVSV